MGELLERVNLSKLIYGNGEAENFKTNSLFFFERYKESNEIVRAVRRSEIAFGGFYFLHYLDDSNWMRYSPVFTISYKKFDNLIILLAINFNFLPVEIRVAVFDNFIKKADFDEDNLLEVDFTGVYKELLRWGFEYAIVEYNVAQIDRVHKIKMDLVPRFLQSQHPINIYDPNKLYGIWKAKFNDHLKRHEEMSKLLIDELYKIEEDITEEYDMLREHIKRIQRSYQKYGK